LTDTPQHSPQA